MIARQVDNSGAVLSFDEQLLESSVMTLGPVPTIFHTDKINDISHQI